MRKLIAIIGMPGTGKTTLMREWMSSRKWETDNSVKLLNSMISGDIRLFGKYEEGDLFAGTDKLSMAVQPEAIKYLQNPTHSVNIFEGDRLTSIAFFQEALKLGYDLSIVILEVSDQTRERRYQERGSEQNEKFIRGRRTKIENVKSEFEEKIFTGDPCYYQTFSHETSEDTQKVISYINSLIE